MNQLVGSSNSKQHIDTLRGGTSKDSNKRSAKSTNPALDKNNQENSHRVSSKPKESTSTNFFSKVKKDVHDTTHQQSKFLNHNKNVVQVDLTKGSNELKVTGNFVSKSTNFGDYNKTLTKHIKSSSNFAVSSSNHLKVQKSGTNQKSQAENSFNAQQTAPKVKSSNSSFDRSSPEKEKMNSNLKDPLHNNKQKTKKDQSKSSNNLVYTNSEIESPEELHFVYVAILNQNKNLAYKFEGEAVPESSGPIEECDI